MNAATRLMFLMLALAGSSLSRAQEPRQAVRLPERSGHPAVAGDGAACITCHQEITGARVMHGPAAAGQCRACHVVDTSSGVRRVTLKDVGADGATARLCVTCHEEIATRLQQKHRHAPVASGKCTACHDPHGSPFRYQLPVEPARACVSCHQDIGDALTQAYVHAPAGASCQICHDPHAAAQPAQLRARSNEVCLACHIDAPPDRIAADAVSLFGAHRADAIDRLAASGSRILLDASLAAGHPTRGHPIEGREDPSRKGRTLECTSCHNPHGAAGAKLLRFGATGISSLCIRCHGM